MDLSEYLTDTFTFNDKANKMVYEQAKQLDDKKEIIRYFSHLINCQFKWMARIKQTPDAQNLDWWLPVYEFNQLSVKWDESLKLWIDYLNSKTEEELNTEVTFIGFDGGMYAATPKDIALQLNYHSIHHRGQMVMDIRRQGLVPKFTDFIGTKYRKLS
jgi:uncharacterized damage-inducible protein DinB